MSAIVAIMLVASIVAAPAFGQRSSGAASTVGLDRPVITGTGGRIPVRIVDGRLVIACDLSSPSRRIPANLFLEYDGRHGLQLHNRAAAGLRIETRDGRAIPVTIHFPDFNLVMPRRELGDEDDLADFTKYHSAEIGENAIVGSLGAQALAEFDVTFDLPRGVVEVGPPGGLAGASPGSQGGTVTTTLDVRNDLAWLPVTVGADTRAALAIGSSRYDTVLDEALLARVGAPAGAIESLRCGEVELAPLFAGRPERVVQVHPDGVAGVTGLGLLEHVRLELDRASGLARLNIVVPPVDRAAEAALFAAMVEDAAAPIEAWLKEHAEHRLAREAAELLLVLRLEEDAGPEDTAGAVTWIHDTATEDLRATRMLDLMEELANEGLDDLVIVAGRAGAESGRDDRYPDAVHKIRGRLGALLLDRGEDREAWRNLLSAAFGLPEDGPINYDLGRYYERRGQFRRAFSRYIQAVITPEAGPQALEGLQRLDRAAALEERLSVDLVERMIAGKVHNFGAATTYEPGVDPPVRPRRVLVEFFTNAHLGDESRGAIAGALANQGLASHFGDEHAVFLSYHLPEPAPDALVNALAVRRAAALDIPGPWIHRVDGRRQMLAAGRRRDAEQIYGAARDVVAKRLAESATHELRGRATLAGGVLTGSIVVAGPRVPDLRLHVIVAEKGVVFPGRTQVIIHRMVARAALTPPDGAPYRPFGSAQAVPFSAGLDDLSAANEDFLDELASSGGGAVTRLSTRIDPRQVRVVAFLEQGESHDVMQAIVLDPERPEDEE